MNTFGTQTSEPSPGNEIAQPPLPRTGLKPAPEPSTPDTRQQHPARRTKQTNADSKPLLARTTT